MANCPACKLEIPSDATRCPHCTSHIYLEKGVGRGTAHAALYGLFVGGLLGAFVGALFGSWLSGAIILGGISGVLSFVLGLNERKVR